MATSIPWVATNGSVFRKNLGGALLRKKDPPDPRLTEWLRQGGESFPELEEEVSLHTQGSASHSHASRGHQGRALGA